MLVVWAAAMVFVGAILMGRHGVALPSPVRTDPLLGRSLLALRDDPTRTLVVHVLYTECRCAQLVARELQTTARPSDVREAVLIVGKDDGTASRLRSRGYRVVVTGDTELAERYHVLAAPMLVIITPSGEVRYAGGYTRDRPGIDIEDLALIARARTEVVAPLPIIGCAVEPGLRAKMDPTGALL